VKLLAGALLFMVLTPVSMGQREETLLQGPRKELGSFTVENEKISPYYRRGEHLIYDCEDGHFVCVVVENYESCRARREFALRNKIRDLPCAPLKKFSSNKECFAAHYKKMGEVKDKRFCLRTGRGSFLE
jgi:hypothetical protein